MKLREIITCTAIFAVVSILSMDAVSMALRSQHIFAVPNILASKPKKVALDSHCSQQPPIAGLREAQSSELRKLADFQDACGSRATDTLMVFTDMPGTTAEATAKAKLVATKLKEFSKYGVRPLVVSEPVTGDGYIDFKRFRAGAYDQPLEAYFSALKTEGITDQQMGIWVPFPEANLPYWNQTDSSPEDVGADIAKFAQLQKRHFPQSKVSVMLNSATYENSDFNWENGDYASLAPYLKPIPKGLIDSFGMQGFPWVPRATTGGVGIFDAAEFLNPKLVQEAADMLGTKQVWFNTGTFGRKYASDPQEMVTIEPAKRRDVLSGIMLQAIKLRDAGYAVNINIFAEDKSTASEETDWSYWGPEGPSVSESAVVLNNFAGQLGRERIGLWLFDK